MMEAIQMARLGDAARGDDPTVNEFEQFAAELLGKEDALLVPSGAMANLSALIAHGVQGAEVVVEATSHIYNSEGGAISAVAGALPRPVVGTRGMMAPEDIASALRVGRDLALAPTRLICVENTHNAAGGRVLPLDDLAAIRSLADESGLSVHMDGARLLNAGAYLDAPLREIARYADSVWFALCKGLGCPVGAALAGSGEFMQRARRAAKMLGGGMRQAGILAAPALVALRDPYPVHRRDHARARRLAEGLAAIDASLVSAESVQTNIVNCHIDRFTGEAGPIREELRARGVLVLSKGTKIRFVTHYQVDDEAVDAALSAFADAISRLSKAA
jgi:threonine aldolase